MTNQVILYTSWGYDMTNNDYALVLEKTEKTVKCVMIGNKILSGDGWAGREVPNPEDITSEPFRLRINKSYGLTFRGSYKFCQGSESKRKGVFRVWNNKPNYYNTMD